MDTAAFLALVGLGVAASPVGDRGERGPRGPSGPAGADGPGFLLNADGTDYFDLLSFTNGVIAANNNEIVTVPWPTPPVGATYRLMWTYEAFALPTIRWVQSVGIIDKVVDGQFVNAGVRISNIGDTPTAGGEATVRMQVLYLALPVVAGGGL